MRFEILGIEKVDYKSRRTGQQVRGTNLHCQVLGDNSRIDGIAVDKIYCKEAIDCSVLKPGDCVEAYYNRFGSVESIHIA